MKKVGLIADTHNYLDPQVFEYFEDRDEIWHAGDFGNFEIAEQLEEIEQAWKEYVLNVR